jgi:chromosome segregation ATPase
MMKLEELKARLSAGRFALDEVAGLASEALAAIESLQRELELEKIERKTFQHGHRIASDNCARLERELEEARRPFAPKMSAGGGPGYLIKDMILAGGGLKGPP